MRVKFFAIAMALLLSFIPATVAGKDKKTPAEYQDSSDKSLDPSFRELLEFLGQWETDGGNWVDPTDIEWLMTPEQESREDEKKKP